LRPVLSERVYHPYPVNLSRFLEVFREKYATSSLLGGANHQSVPERKPVKSMQVDGGKDVVNFGRSHIELSEQFDLPTSNHRVNVQFTRDGDEILLQYLERNHASSALPVFRQKVEGASLLCRFRPVV
jgi:hypothetical protein